MAHVAEYKKKIVDDIVRLIKEYPIIGVVNMENLPAPQLQAMRAQLRGKVALTMTKKRLMKIALEQVKNEKKGIEKLKEHLNGMPALIFTKDSPFILSKILQKNKSSAPAKAGQTAPKDIIVNKGSTGFAPGPIIGELGMIGIKAGVEGGKVAIKEDVLVARQGEQIKPKVAEILTRLGIKPMEVGLDLMAAYEDGLIYAKDILTIDEEGYISKVNNAARNAFNLAFNIAYATKDNIILLLGKAFNDAKALGLSQEILDDGIVEELLAKAERSMLSLKDSAKIEISKKPETKVEKPEVAEEKKETIEKEVAIKEPKKEEEQKKEKIKEKIPEKEEIVPKEELRKGREIEEKSQIKIEEKAEEPKKEIPKTKPEKTGERKIIEEDVKEKKTETDKKVEAMVKKTVEFAEKKEPTAEDIVKEIEKETKIKKETKESEEEKEEIPSSHELSKKKKEKEQKEVEDLAKELVRKGTLRK